jgi:hypothetical protein
MIRRTWNTRSIIEWAIVACLFLCILSCVVIPLATRKGLRFGDHGTEKEWRNALLQEVPLGSSKAEVIAFLERKGFSPVSDWSSCDAYSPGDAHPGMGQDYVSLRLCPGWLSTSSGYWSIDFLFDESGTLVDIIVELGPT